MNLSRIKEIVVLYGEGNSGKTGILKRFCSDIKQLVGSANYCSWPQGKGGKDIFARALLPDKRVLGIGTAGDSADTVLEDFISFHDQGTVAPDFSSGGCDIVVLAVRTLSQRRKFATGYKPTHSLAEIELEELLKNYGAGWKNLVPNGKTRISTTRFKKGIPSFKHKCRTDANNVLQEIRAVVRF